MLPSKKRPRNANMSVRMSVDDFADVDLAIRLLADQGVRWARSELVREVGMAGVREIISHRHFEPNGAVASEAPHDLQLPVNRATAQEVVAR